MAELKQSTVTIVKIGPFVGTGGTVITDLTIPQAGVRLSKAGGNMAQKSTATACVHDEIGVYFCDLSAADTDTLGRLRLDVDESGSAALAVFHNYEIVTAQYYDAKYGTGRFEADVQEIDGASAGVTNMQNFYDGTGYAGGTIQLIATPGNATLTAGVFAADAITAGTLATGALTADAFAADALVAATIATGAFTADAFAANAITAGTIADAAIDAATFAADAINAAAIAGSALVAATFASDSITAAKVATDVHAEAADAVWDEILTGAEHNIATSAGRRLRGIQEFQGYENGAIWIDTVNGVAGTVNYENGTVENPVNSIADANVISTSLHINRFRVAAGSSILFVAAQENQVFIAYGATIALGGQSINGTLFEGPRITGNDDGSNVTPPRFRNCKMGGNTLGQFRCNTCPLVGNLTFAEAGTYILEGCLSAIAGTTNPAIDIGSGIGDTNLHMRHYSGGVEIQHMGSLGTDIMNLEGGGALVINANCSAGTIVVNGNFTLTDNASGAVTVNDDARIDVAQINAEVDTALSDIDLDHLINNGAAMPTPTAGTIFDDIMNKDASQTFNATTDSLEALRDRGDTAWVAGAGASATTIAAACGTALTTYDGPTNTEMDTAHALLATPTQVNAQVLDVLSTDTFAEPGQGAPAATTSIKEKIGYMYKFMRNKIISGSAQIAIYNDAGAVVDQKSTISDDSTNFTRGEFGTGA